MKTGSMRANGVGFAIVFLPVLLWPMFQGAHFDMFGLSDDFWQGIMSGVSIGSMIVGIAMALMFHRRTRPA